MTKDDKIDSLKKLADEYLLGAVSKHNYKDQIVAGWAPPLNDTINHVDESFRLLMMFQIVNSVMILSGSITMDRFTTAVKAAQQVLSCVPMRIDEHSVPTFVRVTCGYFRYLLGEGITYPPDFPPPDSLIKYRPQYNYNTVIGS